MAQVKYMATRVGSSIRHELIFPQPERVPTAAEFRAACDMRLPRMEASTLINGPVTEKVYTFEEREFNLMVGLVQHEDVIRRLRRGLFVVSAIAAALALKMFF